MTPHPRLSKAGIELVKRFEGLRHKAARLADGGWTVGYGHTASARQGAEVTAGQAEMLLIYDLDRVARAIEPLMFTPLNANQFNALVAFAFNVGVDNFRASAVVDRVNEGAYLQAAAAIELWRRAPFDGESLVVDGLVRRRAAEKLLFLTPTGGFRPIPTPVVRPTHDSAAADLRNHARGLAGAADLHAPLDGDRAFAERSEVEAAARNLSNRLQQMFPESEPTLPEPDPQEPAAPPFHEPEAAPPAPERVVEPAPPPPAEVAASSEPFDPPPRWTAAIVDDKTAEPPSDFGRRHSVEASASSSGPRSRPNLVLAAGLIGALMFIGALLAMIFGKASLMNLCIGLVGVVGMIPAGLRLLLGLLGDRPTASR